MALAQEMKKCPTDIVPSLLCICQEACEFRESKSDAEIYCFYMDLRMFGRGYEDLYLKAKIICNRFIRAEFQSCEVWMEN
jgi:heterodisulfide reductase subunit A